MIDRAIIDAGLFRCRKKALPPDGKQKKIPSKKPLSEVRFVVFDTETTGFDLKTDKIISIGAIALTAQRIEVGDSFEVLVRQEKVGDRDAVSVHGLLRKDIASGIDEKSAVTAFLDYIGNSVLVAQHAGFDTGCFGSISASAFSMMSSIRRVWPKGLKKGLITTLRTRQGSIGSTIYASVTIYAFTIATRPQVTHT